MTGASGPSGYLLHNLLLFGRLLRGLGLDVNPSRMITVVEALDHIAIGNKSDFYFALRCLLVHDHDDLDIFDQAFQLFWRQPVDQTKVLIAPARDGRFRHSRQTSTMSRPQNRHRVQSTTLDQNAEEEPTPLLEIAGMYSDREVLRQKDFSELDSGEIEAIKKMMAQLIWQLGRRKTRRFQPGRGKNIDMRHSLRHNLKYGGEIMSWSYRKPKITARPLVIIADVSGSMERYTRLMLHFVYGLIKGLAQPVEVFLFSTRLTRITRQLQNRDVDQAMQDVAQVVPDWSGGTRIGEALKRFNYDWARRVLGRGAITLLISDGWDRGDPQVLADELALLQRSSFRLVWLNPLLGSPDYEPLTRGMQAALPYIDDFLPVHNLASLEGLTQHLGRINDRRPARRQHLSLLMSS